MFICLLFQAKIRSRNEFGFSAETILENFQTFDIQGATTESTTNIFQKISIIDSHNEKVYFQDEQPSTSTIKVTNNNKNNGFINKEMVNSEPLSTINQKGKNMFELASTFISL